MPSYTPPEAMRDARILQLVHPRFQELAGEPLYAEELATELVEAAAMHEDAVADLEGRQPRPATVVAERVAQALYHVYGYDTPTAAQGNLSDEWSQ